MCLYEVRATDSSLGLLGSYRCNGCMHMEWSNWSRLKDTAIRKSESRDDHVLNQNKGSPSHLASGAAKAKDTHR
jgi:hypothetical protein